MNCTRSRTGSVQRGPNRSKPELIPPGTVRMMLPLSLILTQRAEEEGTRRDNPEHGVSPRSMGTVACQPTSGLQSAPYSWSAVDSRTSRLVTSSGLHVPSPRHSQNGLSIHPAGREASPNRSDVSREREYTCFV